MGKEVKQTRIKLDGADLIFCKERYSDGSLAITVIDLSEGYEEEFLTLSTNMSGHTSHKFDPNINFFVKLDGTHRKIIDELDRIGVVAPLNKFVSTGYNTYSLYQVSPSFIFHKESA